MTNTLEKNYIPNENEEYMSPKQLQFFTNKLNVWKENLKIKNSKIDEQLKSLNIDINNINSFAANQPIQEDLLREKDKNFIDINKIEYSLEKIKNKTFGYCEYLKTPIGVKRLIAIPIAKFSLEAQIQFENQNNFATHQ